MNAPGLNICAAGDLAHEEVACTAVGGGAEADRRIAVRTIEAVREGRAVLADTNRAARLVVENPANLPATDNVTQSCGCSHTSCPDRSAAS